MNERIYDKISALLTEYENRPNPNDLNVNWEIEFYWLLVDIQNSWDDIAESFREGCYE